MILNKNDTLRLKNWLTETIDFYKDTQNRNVTSWFCFKPSKRDKENMPAIVTGFIKEIDEPYMKFAIQGRYSIMQEYNVNWFMPFDAMTGEVDDSEIPLSDDDDDIEFLLRAYKRYLDS